VSPVIKSIIKQLYNWKHNLKLIVL
jgi:hypothetical protein